MNFYRTNIKNNDYVIATYDIKTKDADLKKASWELAIGQSVGNPHERSQWETDELFEKHSCIILHEQKERRALLKLRFLFVILIGTAMASHNFCVS